MKRIKVDIPAIKEYLRENGMMQVDVCRRIGRGPNFLCSCTGDMAEYTYDLLIQVLGVEDGAFQKKEDVQPTKVNNGAGLYTLGLDVSPEKVVLRMYFQGAEICKAYSKVKGTREVDLMQAISYAAHMMYKFAEQKELDKEI